MMAGADKPSPAEIVEYARWIGMDPLADSHLLWICEEALDAPLPDGWSEHFDEEDEAYYHNAHSAETTREHPLDVHYRQLYFSLKQRSQGSAEPAPAPQPQRPGGPSLGPASVPRPPRPAVPMSIAAAGPPAEPSALAAAAAVAEAARQMQAQRMEALTPARQQQQPPAVAAAAAAVSQLPGVADAEDREIGDDEKYKVGRCTITSRQLGQGSNGSLVHRGYWKNHPCAVKSLRKAFWALAQADLQAVLGLWAPGASGGSSSGRDNLLQYFGVEEDREFVYLGMERCKRPLSQLIASEMTTSWDPRMRRHVLEQSLSAAEFLHSKGVVHLLLKPSNVFVDERYDVKVADCGLGRSLLTNPGAGGVAGAYLSAAGWRARELLLQEQDKGEEDTAAGAVVIAAEAAAAAAAAAGAGKKGVASAAAAARAEGEGQGGKHKQRKLTSAADVFALGCLGFCLLTHGQHPFGDRIRERDERVLKGNSGYDIAVLNATEPEGYDMISSMVQASPKGRPTAAAARRHPYFWDQPRRAAFICSVSHLLSGSSTVAVAARKRLNHAKGAAAVVRDGSWDILLDAPVLAYMTSAQQIEGRGYDRNSVHDLLRLVAFTLGQLEPELQQAGGAGWRRCISSAATELIGQAGGTLQYFTSAARFPGLLMFTYWHVFNEAGDAKGRNAEMWAPLHTELHGAKGG